MPICFLFIGATFLVALLTYGFHWAWRQQEQRREDELWERYRMKKTQENPHYF